MADFKHVVKDTLYRYISYLYGELKAKDIAMKELTSVFKETITDLNEKKDTMCENVIKDTITPLVNDVKETLNKISVPVPISTVPPISTEQPTVQTPSTEIPKIDPYTECKSSFLGNDAKNELHNFAKEQTYSSVNGQREVVYYGDYRYKYTGGDHKAADIPNPIRKLINAVESIHPDTKVNSAMISKYANGMAFCPPHCDDEKSLCPTSMIYTFSIGETRVMKFREKHDPNNTSSVSLADNSLMIFSRQSQAYWMHSIEPDEEITGERYSITLRTNSPHFMNSTIIYGDSNTKFFKFGEGEGTFGAWMPGERVKTQRVEDLPRIENIPPYQNIVLHVGVNNLNTNHINQSRSPVDLINVIEKKCKEIHSVYPSTRILISPLLPTKSRELNNCIWEVNECIVKLCNKHHNYILINNHPFADSFDGTLLPKYAKYYGDDAVHLGREGVRLFASNIKSYIMRKNTHITQSLNFNSALKFEQSNYNV